MSLDKSNYADVMNDAAKMMQIIKNKDPEDLRGLLILGAFRPEVGSPDRGNDDKVEVGLMAGGDANDMAQTVVVGLAQLMKEVPGFGPHFLLYSLKALQKAGLIEPRNKNPPSMDDASAAVMDLLKQFNKPKD